MKIFVRKKKDQAEDFCSKEKRLSISFIDKLWKK